LRHLRHISRKIYGCKWVRRNLFIFPNGQSLTLKNLESETVKIGVQVNGKVRSELVVDKDASEDSVKEQAMQDENVTKWIENKEIKKIIYVKGRLLNIVI
jgi:leucyl-tRNA synthetase